MFAFLQAMNEFLESRTGVEGVLGVSREIEVDDTTVHLDAVVVVVVVCSVQCSVTFSD
jgi:hypothetical protein